MEEEAPEGVIPCTAMDGVVHQVPAREVRHRVAAYGLVIDRHCALMIRLTENGKLFLPGGGSEPWETLHDTVRREGKKETGLDLVPGGLLMVGQDNFYHDYRTAPGTNSVMFFFSATVSGNPEALVAGDPEEGIPEWVPLRSIFPEVLHLPIVDILPDLIKDR